MHLGVLNYKDLLGLNFTVLIFKYSTEKQYFKMENYKIQLFRYLLNLYTLLDAAWRSG